MNGFWARVLAFLSFSVFAFSSAAATAPAAADASGSAALTISGPFGTVPLVSFEGEEAISSPFLFTAEIAGDPTHPIAFDSVLGQEVTIELTPAPGAPRHFSGICSSIAETFRDRRLLYQINIVPRLSRLTENAQSRIFQGKSVPEILQRVLMDHGIVFQSALARAYAPREFVVQYRETDFNFISRLMEEEGIFYFFRHEQAGHTMVIGDSPGVHPALAGAAQFLPAVQHGPAGGVTEWTKAQDLRPGKVTLRDHNFQLPDNNLEFSASIQPTVAVGQVTHHLDLAATSGLEIYDYPGGYAKRFDGVGVAGIFSAGPATASTRIQELAADAILIDGASNLPQFLSGSKFTIAQHPNANGDYVLTRVHHSSQGGRRGLRSDYRNTFTCIPSALPFRPKRLATRPVIAGRQLAVVTGPTGEEVFKDQLGRVKVQFFWDRLGTNDQSSSMWVRVAALHAGLENGFLIVPRVGQEVVVSFLEGDPDQPIIVGSAYGPTHLPPD
jgi:type VI secretion system secreted protein VgrG